VAAKTADARSFRDMFPRSMSLPPEMAAYAEALAGNNS
jgi:hypothetical protein